MPFNADAILRFQVQGAGQGALDIGKLHEEFKKLVEAFKEGAHQAEGFGGIMQVLAGAFEALKTPLGTLTTIVGAFVGVLEHSATVAVEVFKEMRNLMAMTGESATETKALVDAFTLMGFEADSLHRALFRLSAEMESGGKKLNRLGIAVVDAAGNMRSTLDVFKDVVVRLGQMGDAAERNAKLRELFGRQGMALAAMFAEGGHALEDYIGKAKELGILTEHEMQQTKELVQAKALLNLQIEHIWMAISEIGVPALTALITGISETIKFVIALGKELLKLGEVLASNKLLPFKYIVDGIMLVYNAAEKAAISVYNFGKAVKDYLVYGRDTSKDAKEEKKQEQKEFAPIESVDDIKFRTKLREAELKIDEKFFEEQSRMETGSRVAALEGRRRNLAEILEIERSAMNEELARLPKESLEQRIKIQRDFMMKSIAMEGERRILLLKIREAELADDKKLMEEKLKAEKIQGDLRFQEIKNQRERELLAIEDSNRTEVEKAEQKKTLEISSAREAANVKITQINIEIAEVTKLIEKYKDMALIRREMELKIQDLVKARRLVEMETTLEVDKARTAAHKAEMDRRAKEAGMFGQLLNWAEKFAQEQGRMQVYASDIKQAYEKVKETAMGALSAFFGGGGVDPKMLKDALGFVDTMKQMKQTGSSPEGVIGAKKEEIIKASSSAEAYQMAEASARSGDKMAYEIGMQIARAMRESERASEAIGIQASGKDAGKGFSVEEIVARVKGDAKSAIVEAVNGLGQRLPDMFKELFGVYNDLLIRELENDARRA